MRPGEVRDPYLPLLWLVAVEAPDPHVNEVVRGALSGVEERLELPYADVGSYMREEGHSKAPVGSDALQVPPEDAYQVVGRHGGGMISLSRDARVPREGVSSDALLLGSVCMSSVPCLGCGGVRLWRAVGDCVALGSSNFRVFVIASSVPCSVSPLLLRWCCTELLDRACTVATVEIPARSVWGPLSGAWVVTDSVAVVAPVALISVSQPCAPPAAWAGVRSGACGRSCWCCGSVTRPLSREGRIDCAEVGTAPMPPCGVPKGSCGLGAVSPALVQQGAPDELEVAGSAVAVCMESAARRARSVCGRMEIRRPVCTVAGPLPPWAASMRCRLPWWLCDSRPLVPGRHRCGIGVPGGMRRRGPAHGQQAPRVAPYVVAWIWASVLWLGLRSGRTP